MKKRDDFTKFIKIKGVSIYNDKLHGLTTRTKGGPNAAQFMQLDSMRKQKLRRREFVMCSKMGSLLRGSMRNIRFTFRSSLNYDLNGELNKVILLDRNNDPGNRSLDLKVYGAKFSNYSLSNGHIDTVLYFNHEFQISEDRQMLKCIIPAFNPEKDLSKPGPCNYYRLFMHANVITDFNFNVVKEVYEPAKENAFIFHKDVETAPIPTFELTEAMELNLDLGFIPESNHAVILAFGIEFIEKESNRVKSQEEWSYCKIVGIV